MADRMEIRSLDKPEEETHLEDGSGMVETVRLDGVTVSKLTLYPGWSWEQSVKPMVSTDSCEVSHNQIILQGRMRIQMDDGSDVEVGPGDVIRIPPGHHASVDGNQTFIAYDFSAGDDISIADTIHR